ncbi:MAG: ATP-dependent DNA helicase DinG, partial [Kiritimatiellia bacterium]
HLAGIYGDDGVGMVIVDSDVRRDNWVIEPHAEHRVSVDESALHAFFEHGLPRAMPDFEARDEQIMMSKHVLHSLNEEVPVVVEAGTGTGKSLAYLAPSALWALANDRKVVVSTFTKALQGQLIADDLPLVRAAGLDVRIAVLQGRGNYVCKRRLAIVDAEETGDDGPPELPDLLRWSEVTLEGSRNDLPIAVPVALWERVQSDTDLTLRVRCPHYQTCFYYQARRRAAGAHIVVVNHALLLSDLHLKKMGAPGILPRFDRLILDEGHHVEDAATGVFTERLTLRAIQRAVAPLLTRRRRRGVLERLAIRHGGPDSPLDEAERATLGTLVGGAVTAVHALRDEGGDALVGLRQALLDDQPLRATAETIYVPPWLDQVEPGVQELIRLYHDVTALLGGIHALFDEKKLSDTDAAPVMELARARRRLVTHQGIAERFVDLDGDRCQWLSAPNSRRDRSAVLQSAPIEIGPYLTGALWEPLPGTTSTSATLSIGGSSAYWMRRVGLSEAEQHIYASPFDYPKQALLALPRDLPAPNHPDFLEATSACIIEAVLLSQGGTFVLCTSYKAASYYAAALREVLPATWPVLEQGTQGRDVLVRRFRESRRAVLVGTDTFWEGVSIKGMALRQVIVPRIPFRVPSDPLHQAQIERERQLGRDPFRSRVLPHAVLRMRQGFGRLIRGHADRGVVLLLDRRLHEASYGRVILYALPKARRIKGPWRQVHEGLEAWWQMLAAQKRLRQMERQDEG